MTRKAKMRLAEMLVRLGILDEGRVETAVRLQNESGKHEGLVLVEMHGATWPEIQRAYSIGMFVDLVSLKDRIIDPALVALLPPEVMARRLVVPIDLTGRRLTLATTDFCDVLTHDAIQLSTGLQIKPVEARPGDIYQALWKTPTPPLGSDRSTWPASTLLDYGSAKLLSWAKLHVGRFEPELAIPFLQQVLVKTPEDFDVRCLLLRQYQEAFLVQRVDEVLGESRVAVVSRYRQKAREEPRFTPCLELGILHALLLDPDLDETQNLEAAAPLLEKASQMNVEQVALESLARVQERSGQSAEAKDSLQRVVEERIVGQDPRPVAALVRLAEMAARLGDFSEALEAYGRAIEAAPRDPTWRMRRIELQKRAALREVDSRHCFQAATQAYELAVNRQPKDAMLHFDLGYAHLTFCERTPVAEENLRQAEDQFQQALTVEPGNPVGFWGLRRVHEARSMNGNQSCDLAVDVCRQALLLNRQRAHAHFELAEALNGHSDQNQKPEALREYLRTAALDPEMVEVQFKIAEAYRILNDFDRAVSFYRRVVLMDPTSPFAEDARRCLTHAVPDPTPDHEPDDLRLHSTARGT